MQHSSRKTIRMLLSKGCGWFLLSGAYFAACKSLRFRRFFREHKECLKKDLQNTRAPWTTSRSAKTFTDGFAPRKYPYSFFCSSGRTSRRDIAFCRRYRDDRKRSSRNRDGNHDTLMAGCDGSNAGIAGCLSHGVSPYSKPCAVRRGNTRNHELSQKNARG